MKYNKLNKFYWACLLPLGLTSCSSDNDVPVTVVAEPPVAEAEPRFRAKITRTQFNVAHIEADDLGSIGFGQGYATAQDAVCVLADQFVKVQSERAKYFGAGPNNAFVASDLGYLALGVIERAEEAFSTLSENSRALISGYAAGYNQYLTDTPSDDLPAACAGAEWVRPITPEQLFAFNLDTSGAISASSFVPFIAAASPPSAAEKSLAFDVPDALPSMGNSQHGSNMLGLGSEMTESGRGMLLANPHLPWFGNFTYTEQHLTIPGELNVSGIQVLGVPMLGIGFGDNGAQSVTVSATTQYTAYQLILSGDDGLSYVYDDEIRDIAATDVMIEVLQEDGTLANVEQTYYRSHFGPMLSIPFVGEWTAATAVSARFPDFVSLTDSYIQTMLMTSNDEFKALLNDTGGSPFLNYTRVSPQGEVYYVDAAPIPNLSPEAIQSFFGGLASNPVAAALLNSGIVLLDGSSSTFEWVDDEQATTPGTIPLAFAPQYEGSDYAVHTNDSAWLVNETSPTPLISPLYGTQMAPRQPRNRTGFTLVREGVGTDDTFNMAELQDLQFNNRSALVEMIKDDLAEHCLIEPSFNLDGALVDLTQACTLLEQWDGRYDLDSVGAPIFREFISQYTAAQLTSGEGFFAVPFDPANPTTTPNTLLIADVPRAEDTLLRNLAIAVTTLSTIDIPLSAPLSEWQFTDRSGERVPLPGATGAPEGAWNVVGYDTGILNSSLIHRPTDNAFVNPATALSADGYVVNLGPSYIMTVTYEGDTPRAEAMLVYGQSRDPGSEHHDDQMILFSEERFRPAHFTSADVAENAVSEITVSSPVE